MEQSIKETAEKYRKMTAMLEDFEVDEPFDGDIPEDVQAAFIRLYYAKAFGAEIEKCEEMLGEETDEETVDAVIAASGAAEAASEAAFGDIEDYIREDEGFARMMEGISVSSEIDGLKGLLYKLYKCESIIRAAQRCSMRFPIYGMSKHQSVVEPGFDVMDQQESIEKNVGIDIYGLIELREELVGKIGASLGKDGRFA